MPPARRQPARPVRRGRRPKEEFKFSDADREQAWRALDRLKMMLPQLRTFARIVTGNPKVDVTITGDIPHASGDTIAIRPPLGLGREMTHDRANCGKRRPDNRQTCYACQVMETVEFYLFHEIAHIAFGTHAAVSTADRRRVGRLIDEWHPAGACTHAVDLKAQLHKAENVLALAAAFSLNLTTIVNCLEDSRVNERMFEARPGTRTIFELNIESMMTDGVEAGVDKYIPWRDAAVDSQFMIGLCDLASGRDIGNSYLPNVVEALGDRKLQAICSKVTGAANVHEILAYSIEALMRAQELGFCLIPKCEIPPPQPEPPAQPEPESNEAGEDGQGQSGTTDPESDPSGSSEPSEGSDSNESGGDEPAADGKPDSEPEPEPESPDPGGSGTTDDDPSDDGSSDESDADADGGSDPQGGGDEESNDSDGNPSAGVCPGDLDEIEGGGGGGRPDGEADDPEESEDDSDRGSGKSDSDEDSRDENASADEDEAGDSAAEADGSGDEQDEPEREPLDESVWDTPTTPGAGIDALPDGANEAPSVAQDGPEPNDPNTGTPEQTARDLARFLMHGGEDVDGIIASLVDGDVEEVLGIPLDEGEELPESLKQVIVIAVQQMAFFDTASHVVAGVETIKFPDTNLGWVNNYSPDEFTASESLLGAAVLRARRVFEENQRTKISRNLKSGRINSRTLGKRAPVGDPRMFGRRELPKRRSYSVILGGDCSGSTWRGDRNAKIKRAIMAQGDLLNRLGVRWSGWMHSAYFGRASSFQRSFAVREDPYYLYMMPFKTIDEPWNIESRTKLANAIPVAENLDGHTLEFYRKQIQRETATDKIIVYYTDGDMPAANYDEEVEILLRELEMCARLGITVLGVGINTDSPRRYGLDTVRVDSDEDIHLVIEQLGRKLMEK